MKKNVVSWCPIQSGWTTSPTSKSENARLQTIIIDVERMEGVPFMATITNAFPEIDMNISGTLVAQFMITTVSELSRFPLYE